VRYNFQLAVTVKKARKLSLPFATSNSWSSLVWSSGSSSPELPIVDRLSIRRA